jgi:hypothetical protein
MSSYCFCLCTGGIGPCADVLSNANLTGDVIPTCLDTPVLGLPNTSLCELPLTNPCVTYGADAGSTQVFDPITSPCSHGGIDTPPCANNSIASQSASRNGVTGGAGTAGSQFANRPACTAYAQTGSLLSRFGTALTSILGGKQQTPYLPGRSPSTFNANTAPTSFGFFLIALLVGFILYKLAFSE